jgi:hypothetical protein
LEIVKPKKIYVFAIPPVEENPDAFLNRLAGLCKYALNQRGGRAKIHELAAAMASREGAVEIGLQWLATGGHLSVETADDEVTLSVNKPDADQYLQKELYIALRGILNETSAYRKYFAAAADVQALFVAR